VRRVDDRGLKAKLIPIPSLAPSRGRLLPDPKQDPIAAVFYCLQDSKATLNQPISEHGYYTGIWMVESEKNKFSRLGNLHGLFVEYFESELDLFNEIVDRVRSWDPDVLAGWEVHGSSWGYLAGRASEEFGEQDGSVISSYYS
jgi:DNA polymerase zeta